MAFKRKNRLHLQDIRAFPSILSCKITGVLLVASTLLCAALPAEGYDRRTAVVEAVEKAGPAVVNIRTEQIVKRRSSPWFGFGDSFFDKFFSDFASPRLYKTQSLGSGVVIDAQGHVLTNAHVVEKASKIYVALPNRRKELEATLVGVDERIDLAVLQIEADEEFAFLPPGRSDDLMLGESVIAIGNPLGLGHSITTGVVSSPQRRIPMDGNGVAVFIQTDALINPGNSGGPLININGELIGINTAIATQAQGIGFSIPIDVVQRVLADLIDHGRVRRALLGIIPGRVGEAFAESRGSGGILVTEVTPGSPAAQAGLQVADVLLSLDGVDVESPEEFLAVLRTYTPGDKVKLRILRGMEVMEGETRLGAVSRDDVFRYVESVFGFEVAGSERGVSVMGVRPGSAADKIGLRVGDRIAEINGASVASVDDFVLRMEDRLGQLPLNFLIVRGNRGYYVDLP